MQKRSPLSLKQPDCSLRAAVSQREKRSCWLGAFQSAAVSTDGGKTCRESWPGQTCRHTASKRGDMGNVVLIKCEHLTSWCRIIRQQKCKPMTHQNSQDTIKSLLTEFQPKTQPNLVLMDWNGSPSESLPLPCPLFIKPAASLNYSGSQRRPWTPKHSISESRRG